MVAREFWIGSVGPFRYNDANLFQDGSPHRVAVDRPPVANDDVLRLQDIGGIVGGVVQIVATANINDPTELNALDGFANGALAMVAETAVAALDEMTIYAWDSNPGAALEDPPYLVDGNAGSMWIAVGGSFQYEGIRFGDSANYGEFEDDGTIVFVGNATVWDDLFFPMSTGKVGGANQPTWAAFQGNTFEYTFGINDYIHLPTQEIGHKYLEGSDITLHCHIVTNGSDVGNTEVNYELEYSIGDMGEVMSGAVVVTSGNFLIPGGTADRTHFYVPIDTIAGAGYRIGAALKLRFRRIARVGGTGDPTADPFVLMAAAHVQMDTVGSRTELGK